MCAERSVQNEISYKDYLTKNRDDVAQDYYDKANEIYSNISYPDSDDANYGSGVAAALRNEQQAKSLMEQGDENTDDQATMRIQYDQAEARLAKQAQGLMIAPLYILTWIVVFIYCILTNLPSSITTFTNALSTSPLESNLV